jgi:hypothetical protein
MVALSSTACTRTHVVIPEMTTEVTTSQGEPIADARMYLERLDWRDDFVVDEGVFSADAHGQVRLDEKLEREGSYPLIMNGVPDYYFLVCFKATGYHTITNRLTNVSPGDIINVTLPLNAGTAIPCNEVIDPFDNPGERFTPQVREDVLVDIRGRADFRFFVEWLIE